MTFEEWLIKVKEMLPVLLWISPKKWHANETIYVINDDIDLDWVIKQKYRSNIRLEAVPMPDILLCCCPQPSVMSLIWDKPYSLMAGRDEDGSGLVVMRHADPLWEFLIDPDNRDKKFEFIRAPSWDDAVTCIVEEE